MEKDTQRESIPFSTTKMLSLFTQTQFVSMFWTSYITVSMIALIEFIHNQHVLSHRIEELEFKYDSKLHALAEQDVRIAELEKRLAIISQNASSKMESLGQLANMAMLRIEQMDQTLKTHILAVNSPKSSPKKSDEICRATETVILEKVEEMIAVETQERQRIRDTTYTILYELLRAVYQGTQDLSMRWRNLNRGFWNKDVVPNVFDYSN